MNAETEIAPPKDGVAMVTAALAAIDKLLKARAKADEGLAETTQTEARWTAERDDLLIKSKADLTNLKHLDEIARMQTKLQVVPLCRAEQARTIEQITTAMQEECANLVAGAWIVFKGKRDEILSNAQQGMAFWFQPCERGSCPDLEWRNYLFSLRDMAHSIAPKTTLAVRVERISSEIQVWANRVKAADSGIIVREVKWLLEHVQQLIALPVKPS